MYDISKVDDLFVMDEYRDGQRACIEAILDAYNEGKRVAIVEAPTGSGKTIIGMTVAQFMRDMYYLTITKQLQSQLVKDFSDVVELKGRNAYKCTYYDRMGSKLVANGLLTREELKKINANCDCGFCKAYAHTRTDNRKLCPECFAKGGPIKDGTLNRLPDGFEYSACRYFEQLYKAINSRAVVMNFSSFLYQTAFAHRFGERELLIIDECHNIEQQILGFISFSINDLKLKNLGVTIPEFDKPSMYYKWLEKSNITKKLDALINDAIADGDIKSANAMESTRDGILMFMKYANESDVDKNWVVDYSERKYGKSSVVYRSVQLRPVFADRFTHELLFSYGKRLLLMSATILNASTFMRSIGIDRSDVMTYRMASRFPVSNRPIYLKCVAKMTGGKSKMNQWAPKLTKAVDEIAQKYSGQRGIVHTHNFAIMNHLLDNCCKSVRARMLCQHDFNDKTAMLKEHAKRSDSIIVAPAMHEGIDLAGDLSRFQIICKVPFANFYDDKQLEMRMKSDDDYYSWITMLKLCQSYGRSIRSDDDFADTYILDQAIHYFMKRASHMVPLWFKEAIVKL